MGQRIQAALGAATVLMAIGFAMPWSAVDLARETGGPILERTWHFAPWGSVEDGEAAWLEHPPGGIEGRNAISLGLAVVALLAAVTLAALPLLAGAARALYVLPAATTALAVVAWHPDMLVAACDIGATGAKQRCDLDTLRTPLLAIGGAIAYAGVGLFAVPEPPMLEIGMPALPGQDDDAP